MPADPETKNTYHNLLKILTAIWRRRLSPLKEEMFLVQRLIQSLVVLLLFFSLTSLIRYIFGEFCGRKGRKIAVELYAIFKALFLLTVLLHDTWAWLHCFIVWYFLADLLVNLTAFVLLRGHWKEPASGIRSLILLAFNFVEYTSAFGILYLQGRALICHEDVVTDGVSAFYFSVITAATVGYGDITPIVGWGRKLVTLEVVISLAFVAVVVSRFVSELGGKANIDAKKISRCRTGRRRR